MENQERSTKEIVLSRIKSGETKMKPKWRFTLESLLWAVGASFALLALIYISSLVLFFLRKSGIIFAPLFGFKGIGVFIISLPWILIVLMLAFIVLFEVLIRHYAFTYKRPIIYSLMGVVVIASILGLVLFRAGIHERVLRFGEKNRFPAVRTFYNEYGLRNPEKIQRGVVRDISPEGFTLRSKERDYVVIIDRKTRLPKRALEEGDRVMVLGNEDRGEIRALGVRKINKGFLMK